MIISSLLNPVSNEMTTLREFKNAHMRVMCLPSNSRYQVTKIINMNVLWGASTTKPNRYYEEIFKNNSLNPTSDPKYGYCMTKSHALRYLSSKKYLFESKFKFYVLKERLYNIDKIFPISDRLLVRNDLDLLMLKLRQHGLMQHWINSANRKVIYESQRNMAQLNVMQLIAMKELEIIFWCLFIALILCLIVFLCENLYYFFLMKRVRYLKR